MKTLNSKKDDLAYFKQLIINSPKPNKSSQVKVQKDVINEAEEQDHDKDRLKNKIFPRDSLRKNTTEIKGKIEMLKNTSSSKGSIPNSKNENKLEFGVISIDKKIEILKHNTQTFKKSNNLLKSSGNISIKFRLHRTIINSQIQHRQI